MKVGVIMGGISSEIEVSLNTGREMMNHLDRNKYEVIPVVFSKPEERSKNKEVSLHVE